MGGATPDPEDHGNGSTASAGHDDDRDLSPAAARRLLGTILRQVREDAGLRLEDAARHLQRSSATMSRLETGKLVPRVVDITALLDFYDRSHSGSVPLAVRDRALLLAVESRKREWFSPFRDVITGSLTSDHIQRYVEFEGDAEEILSYEIDFVPGLLQTPGYARAVADFFFADRTERERSRFVEFRLARQAILTRQRKPLRLRAAVRETAVRRVLGGPKVMAEQLDRLAVDLRNGLPNVEIRIVPELLTLPQVMRGSFAVMQFPGSQVEGLVYLEGREGADYLQSEAVVDRYRDDFWELWDAALSKDESLALIEEVTATSTE